MFILTRTCNQANIILYYIRITFKHDVNCCWCMDCISIMRGKQFVEFQCDVMSSVCVCLKYYCFGLKIRVVTSCDITTKPFSLRYKRMFEMLFYRIWKDEIIINVYNAEFWICIENVLHYSLRFRRSISMHRIGLNPNCSKVWILASYLFYTLYL